MLIKALRAALLAATVVLAGCIYSSEDISTQVPPTTPLLEGRYGLNGGDPFQLTLKGDTYHTNNKEFLRFFKLPEFDDYIMQYRRASSDPADPVMYSYYQASIPSNTQFIIREAGNSGENGDQSNKALMAVLPPYLKNLLKLEKDGIVVVSPKRDTLYILREIGRRNIPLNNTASYQRVP